MERRLSNLMRGDKMATSPDFTPTELLKHFKLVTRPPNGKWNSELNIQWHHENDTIYVCGTNDKFDKICNTIITKIELDTMPVVETHYGFTILARTLYHVVKMFKPKLVVGYSLGGSMAQLLSAWTDIPCLTYGSPRVGDSSFASYIDKQHTRVYTDADLIPRIPRGWFSSKDFIHGGEEVKLSTNAGWFSKKFGSNKYHVMDVYIESLEKLIKDSETKD